MGRRMAEALVDERDNGGSGGETMADQVTERIVFATDEEARQFEALVAELDDVTTEREPDGDEGIAPIFALLVLGTAAAVAGAFSYWDEKRKGGQVIDLTPGAPKPAYRTPDVIYGLVVIKAADGTVTVEVKEPRGYFIEVIKTITDALKDVAVKSVEAVKEAVEAAAGDKGTVEAGDTPVPAPPAG
jgi:hypothetical protein